MVSRDQSMKGHLNHVKPFLVEDKRELLMGFQHKSSRIFLVA